MHVQAFEVAVALFGDNARNAKSGDWGNLQFAPITAGSALMPVAPLDVYILSTMKVFYPK